MSYATVSERLKAILEGVEDVYNVHTYLRDIPDEKEFEDAFTVEVGDTPLFTAWMMTRYAVDTVRPAMGPEEILDVTHKVELQGFYGLSDAKESELSFQAVVDEILSALRSKWLLQDAAGTDLADIVLSDAPQVSEIGHGQFSNYFVHHCRVLLSIKERVQ